jgi:type VI secretion system protein ImpM
MSTVAPGSVALTWCSASGTSQGNVRSHNEDAVLELPTSGLWVVADGMGGHKGGDDASRMIVEALCVIPRLPRLSELVDQVEDRLRVVNQRLYRAAAEGNAGISGSTVVALLAVDAYCLSVWAGDSRVYRLREGSLSPITRDHTEVQALLDEGAIDSEAAAQHVSSNIITRAVGGAADLYLDVELRELRAGDRYLLCSDGLYKELGDADLARHLACQDVNEACKAIMSQALAGACIDNVSAVVVEFIAGSAHE